MTQPTPYVPAYSFTDFSSGSPTSQPPGVKIDDEFNALSRTIAEILGSLVLIQRDDGALANGSVGVSQLSAAVRALISSGAFTVRGTWTIDTAYALGDIVSNDGVVYIVMEAHTAADVASDLAAGRLALMFDVGNQVLSEALAQATGATLVGSTGGITVQAALNLKQNIATLAGIGGAATIGTAAGITVEAALAATVSYAALAASTGSANIGFLQSGTGGVTRSIQSKLREIATPADFGVVGDGIVNDRVNIQKMIDSGHKYFYFPDATYWLGSSSTQGEKILDFSALGDLAGATIICGAAAKFKMETTADVIPFMFYLKNNSHFSWEGGQFEDIGYDYTKTWRGAHIFVLDAGASSWGDVTFDKLYVKGALSAIAVGGGSATNRIRGINIGQVFCDNTYYGLSFQGNGDGVSVQNLICFQTWRALIFYGIEGIKAKIFDRVGRGGTGSVNIGRQVSGLSTTGWDIDYTARDFDVAPTMILGDPHYYTHVLINHIDLDGGEISHGKLRVDIQGSEQIYHPVRFCNYAGSGLSESNAASTNIVSDIELTGHCDANALPVSVNASYGSKAKIDLNTGQNFGFNETVQDAFYLHSAGRGLPVTWTASSVNPTLGNGTLYMDWDLTEGMCSVTINLLWGSTTDGGTGEWSFSLPFRAGGLKTGSAEATTGGLYYGGTTRVNAGAATFAIRPVAGGATAFSKTVPATWGTGDRLIATIPFSL